MPRSRQPSGEPIADHIRAIIRARGPSQVVRDLERFSPQYLSRVASGQRRVSGALIERASEVYEIRVVSSVVDHQAGQKEGATHG